MPALQEGPQAVGCGSFMGCACVGAGTSLSTLCLDGCWNLTEASLSQLHTDVHGPGSLSSVDLLNPLEVAQEVEVS